MPPEFLTSHDAWDLFMGDIWCEVMAQTPLAAGGIVIEIGPGASIKIAAALRRCGFRGRFFVVDAEEAALDAIKPRYRDMLPDANIVFLCGDASGLVNDLPAHPDMLLASHVIDDMIIHAGATAAARAWASKYTFAPSDALQTEWQRLSSDAAALDSAKTAARQTLDRLILDLSPARVILNQYPSATLDDHGMASLNHHAADILQQLKTRWGADDVSTALSAFPHYGNRHIGLHVLNPEYWMSCGPTTA
jgi:hypothetical protein